MEQPIHQQSSQDYSAVVSSVTVTFNSQDEGGSEGVGEVDYEVTPGGGTADRYETPM